MNDANLPARLDEQIAAYGPQFKAVLPAHIPVEKFQRVVLTAINNNPDLLAADRRSLFNESVLAANDGLLPDGREAALVVFNTKVSKRGEPDRWEKRVKYMPMIAGIRKRMRNSGEVLSADAYVVYAKDQFSYQLGDDPKIVHVPAQSLADRGEPIGAYAVIKLKNGEVLREVMSKAEIEQIRAMSRAPDSLMWTKVWGEGARKTVLRRCSKAAPTSPEIDMLWQRDDDIEDALPEIEERPTRAESIEAQPYDLWMDDGSLIESYGEVPSYVEALLLLIRDETIDYIALMDANAETIARLPPQAQSVIAEAHEARSQGTGRPVGAGPAESSAPASATPSAQPPTTKTSSGAGVSGSAQSSPLRAEGSAPSEPAHPAGAPVVVTPTAAPAPVSNSAASPPGGAPAVAANQDGVPTAAERVLTGNTVAPAFTLIDHRGEPIYGYAAEQPEAERYFRDLGELCEMDRDLGREIWRANYKTTVAIAGQFGLKQSAKSLAGKYAGGAK